VKTDSMFTPDLLKSAVLSDSEAREFKQLATPVCCQDTGEGLRVTGHLHPDGRFLLAKVGPIPRKKAAQPVVLHLMLHGKWFDAIRYGDKRVEYRQIKSRWTKQIWDKRDRLNILVLHRGYTANVIRATITCIDIGPCPYPGWDGDYYRVHFALAGEIG
jgi:hypothetical protein